MMHMEHSQHLHNFYFLCNSSSFIRASVACFVCQLTRVFMCGMRLRIHCPMGDDCPSPVGIVVFESIWNGGYNGGDGMDNPQTMG